LVSVDTIVEWFPVGGCVVMGLVKVRKPPGGTMIHAPHLHQRPARSPVPAFACDTFAAESRIRVGVLHDDPIVRAGLAFACGRCPDLQVDEQCVDVFVADYANGLALASAPRAAAPSFKVLIVGGSDREWDIRRALEKGVHGYLLGGCTLEELAAGIRAVHRGTRYLSSLAAARLAESVYCERLTAREGEVLRLLIHGLPNKSIASRLGIAVGTVKSHLKASFEKLNVRNRTQAVALVEQRGLLETA
jgi:DNA-binding NarL/FixJ family response regulator